MTTLKQQVEELKEKLAAYEGQAVPDMTLHRAYVQGQTFGSITEEYMANLLSYMTTTADVIDPALVERHKVQLRELLGMVRRFSDPEQSLPSATIDV
jgi:hypothetical protein